MTARKYDIEVEQGATFILKLTYTDSTGVPKDLTGYTVQMQVREAVGGRILASASTTDSRATADSTGVILVTIPHTAVAETKQPRGVYDLFLQSPDASLRSKLLYGNVLFTPAVTR
jgi:hypothetical protein